MDRRLARRLESAEGAINASFVDAHARRSPGQQLARTEIAGAYLVFDGLDSPLTQTFGLGLDSLPTAAELSAIEAFFQQRGAAVQHEISPLAGVETFALLADRGYRPVELTTVLVRPVEGGAPLAEPPAEAADLIARAAAPSEAEAWIEAAVAGWALTGEVAEHIRQIARISFTSPATTAFLVERRGEIIATGSFGMHEGVAHFAGASTLPAHRGLGAQRALLAARLAEARKRGCDVATMGAEPGSISQRNAERNGFRVAYTRTKWKLAATS